MSILNLDQLDINIYKKAISNPGSILHVKDTN